ncbi:TlpA family protein disulfide reductase [Ferrimonas marina]|uniref:Thioredoxin-like domain-containing protein n=1 Tax=Ferrimonas marina TaxID=299255 RepID=A0A1M5N993_9GAMM|nr:TlpA disulfide reductase family protein [Ferrimonas marina]SHG86081.1 Thioredoxin-like domain-containing protein [Ferrimonas marina]
MLKNLSLYLLVGVLALALGGWARGLMMAPLDTQLPEQRLPTLAGTSTSLLDPDGPQLLYLFAPWCTFCKATVDDVLDRQGQGASMAAVALSYQSVDEVAEMVGEHPQRHQVLLGGPQLSSQLGVRGFPSYVIVDAQGHLLWRRSGYMPDWMLGLYLRWHKVL